MVTLRRGANLVAWFGLDGTPLTEAARGIGTSLEKIAVWSAEDQRYLRYDATGLRKSTRPPILSRGDAVWVTVARAVNWLQPTGMLPDVQFPGGVAEKVRNRILADLRDTISFFRETHGIEADFSTYTVYAATDVEALIELYRTTVLDHYDVAHDFGRLRSRWDSAGAWAQDDRVIMKQRHWIDANQATVLEKAGETVWVGRGILTHEYTHIVQTQLSTSDGVLKTFQGYKNARAPQWLTEGSADWVKDAQEVHDERTSWSDVTTSALSEITSAPRLQIAKGDNAYDLGRAASHLIRERAGLTAVIETFRLMNAIAAGPNRRWQLTPSWEEAFGAAVGMSVNDFHLEFESWRGRREDEKVSRQDDLTGQLVGRWAGRAQGGQALDFHGVRLELFGSAAYGLPPAVWADAEGRFVFRGLPEGKYTIRAYFGECWIYRDATVDGGENQHIQIQVGPDTCAHQIRGQVIGQSGADLAGWEVATNGATGFSTTTTQQDGNFVLTVPEPGTYRVRLNIGSCSIQYRGVSSSASPSQAWIEVNRSDVSDVRFVVPAQMCELRMFGKLLNADGSPRSGQWVSASGNAGNGGAQAGADGSFSFAVPGKGSYRLSVWIDGCSIYRGSRGPTKNWNSARQVTVSNADITGLEFRLPEDPSTFCN